MYFELIECIMPKKINFNNLKYITSLSLLGRRYGLFIMKVFLVKLISNFDFQSDFELEKLQFVENISLKFKNADDILLTIQPHNQSKDTT